MGPSLPQLASFFLKWSFHEKLYKHSILGYFHYGTPHGNSQLLDPRPFVNSDVARNGTDVRRSNRKH